MTGLSDDLVASMEPVVLFRRIAEQLCVLVPHGDGATVSLLDHRSCFVVLSAHGSVHDLLGREVPVSETFSRIAVEQRGPVVSGDVTSDVRVTDRQRLPALQMGLRSLLTVPLLRDGVPSGILSLASRSADAFVDDDVARVVAMSAFVSAVISAHAELSLVAAEVLAGTHEQSAPSAAARFLAELIDPDLAARHAVSDEIDELQRAGSLRPVFQPIVHLGEAMIRGLEGLSRFPGDARDARAWFAAARSAGRLVDLELLALETLLAAARALPADVTVGANLSPSSVLDPRVASRLAEVPRPFVVELSAEEHGPHLDDVVTALEPLRAGGLLLSVGDAGSGHDGLLRMLRLRPDVVKVERELTVDLDTDPLRRALVEALVGLAHEMGAATVAEAIETDRQLAALRELGVTYAQGFAIGHPQPVGDLLATVFSGPDPGALRPGTEPG